MRVKAMRESRVNEQKKNNETTMHHYPKVYTPIDVSKSIEQAFTNVAIRE
jgi:hypothetical protein